MLTTEAQAKKCYQNSLKADGELDTEKFGMCMIQATGGNKEVELLKCIRETSSEEERVLCLMAKLGGENEKKISAKLLECYKEHGNDWSKYSLCLASSSNNNSELAKVLACMEQQSRQQGEVTFSGTALCYGLSKLKLNPEMMIVVECAISSGGDPYIFGACAGGQLLARELDKCLENGVGGDDGCFGKNNEIIKGLRQAGELLKIKYGPNNEIVKLWNKSVNDLLVGPGRNHEAIKALTGIANRVGQEAGSFTEKVRSTLPRVTL